jgi:hypothetical protein
MPPSIFTPALVFLLMGVGMAFAGVNFDSLRLLFWIGIGAMVAGTALLLRKNWGRILASVIIFAGYLACGVAFFSLSAPSRKFGVGDYLVIYYFGVFAAIAFLTFLSGNLWSRSATAFLTSPRTSPR